MVSRGSPLTRVRNPVAEPARIRGPRGRWRAPGNATTSVRQTGSGRGCPFTTSRSSGSDSGIEGGPANGVAHDPQTEAVPASVRA